MYSCIPSFMCVNFTYEFFSSYAFVVYLRKLLNQFCVVFSSVTKCMSLLLWFWTSFRINWVSKKPCMEKVLCRLGSIPIIMSTNHVKFVVFLPVVSWHFFLWYFFHGIYLMYIIHTPCLKCWWYLCHVQVTWCLCKKFMQIKPRLTISGMVWLTKLCFQSSLKHWSS